MKRRIVLSFMQLLITIALVVSACTYEPRPDYTLPRIQVSAYTSNTGRTSHWDILLNVKNIGGTKGIVEDGGTTFPVPLEIPIIFTMSFPEERPDGCLSQYSGYAAKVEQIWVPVLTGTGNMYAFSDVFQVPELIHHDCVPYEITAQWDLLLPTYVSTIDETNELNNIISVQIEDWPYTHIWTSEFPLE